MNPRRLAWLLLLLAITASAKAQVVSDPAWGFGFPLPQGWVEKHNFGGAILGHMTIAGVVLVVPHKIGDPAGLPAAMAQGIQVDNGTLMARSQAAPGPAGSAMGDFELAGSNGTVWARVWGKTLSERGGAYVIAMTQPQAFTQALIDAGVAVLSGLAAQAAPPPGAGMSAETAFFVGSWQTMTKNTEQNYTVFPDGTWTSMRTASYSSGDSGQWRSETDPTWGTASDTHTRGRWSVQGNRQQGILTLSDPQGQSAQIQYQVHVKDGQVYPNEYYFDGVLWWKTQ